MLDFGRLDRSWLIVSRAQAGSANHPRAQDPHWKIRYFSHLFDLVAMASPLSLLLALSLLLLSMSHLSLLPRVHYQCVGELLGNWSCCCFCALAASD